MSGAGNPVLVELVRGNLIESRHRGACAVVDAAGGIVAAWGDIGQPVYPRSAIKPLQALPLIESGAASRFQVDAKELALACASHQGEPFHIAAVAAWLARLGLSAADLECGAHMPGDAAAAQALIRAGGAPSALHNNCSGKHTGFLATARHLGEPTPGYIDAAHPVQRRIAAVLAEMTGTDLAPAPRGIDGCGIPVIGVPLAGLARGMARLADPSGLGTARAAACRRLLEAMAAWPAYVAGTASFATILMESLGMTALVKPGAEGVCCAALPGLGYGVALKIDDGAGRAAEIAIGAVLVKLGIIADAEFGPLAARLSPILRNVAGREVGILRPGPAFA